MSATLEVIYEGGIFRPISDEPIALQEHERCRITIEPEIEPELAEEFALWDRASQEDMQKMDLVLETEQTNERTDFLQSLIDEQITVEGEGELQELRLALENDGLSFDLSD
jgi:predicted DNA-binding antitoxin AbrB/MazE fold protein